MSHLNYSTTPHPSVMAESALLKLTKGLLLQVIQHHSYDVAQLVRDETDLPNMEKVEAV
jgi:hypothetical protein